jgi:hypothetical protein
MALGLAVTTLASDGSSTARLCIERVCAPAEKAEKVRIAPSSSRRTATWIASDEMEVTAFEIEPNAVLLRTEPRISSEIRLAAADVPRAINLTLTDGELKWHWTATQRRFVLRRPPKARILVAESPGYRKVERELNANITTLVLERLPAITGNVVDAVSGRPIEKAQVLLPTGDFLASTDTHGKFRGVVEGAWPRTLRVVVVGRADRIVEVSKAVADTDLETIQMSEGGGIVVTLEPPLGGERVHWQIRRGETSEPVREGVVEAGVRDFSINHVSSGRYQLVVQGRGPLQQFALGVSVNDGESAQASMRIQPAALRMRVSTDGAAIEGAVIDLMHRTGGWSAKLRTDAKGEANEEIWQRGLLSALVSNPPTALVWPAERSVDEDRVEWDLAISPVRVRGRVLETATGKPVPEAVVHLGEKYGRDSRLLMSTKTGGDGSYEFLAVPPGDHDLTAMKPGYSESRVVINTAATDDVVDHDVSIALLKARPIVVIDHHGVPIPSTVVMTVDQRGIHEAGETDAEGRLMLPLFAEIGRTTIFVLPRTGSIAIRRLDIEEMRSPETLAIRVPEGTASLEVHAETAAGAPLRTLIFLKIDGVMLPPTVFERWANVQGFPLFTDAGGQLVYKRLPAGQYDLWLIANRADHDAVLSANRPPPAASIKLTAGREVVTARFERAAP